ncbi:recombinase family protein [Pseudoxanthomonas sp. F11]|uniref:recombinase family protein n=1 Tax=Pseudoxanthomonas sp. F11 TaxID=3126308 RepID=UPI00300C59AB
MPKAYSYTRMSTPDQMKGDSRRRQDDSARQYAEANQLEIVERFDDFGVSAFTGRNAEFGALSEFTRLVDEGAIERGSYLLVESMDRLTRQAVPRAMSLLLGLTSRGIRVVTIDDNKVYSDTSNEEDTFALMSALLSMSRAHEESRRKSSMLAEVWKKKRKDARSGGVVTTSKVPGWLRVKNGVVEVIPERAKIVQEIFDMTKNGFGAYSIARRLNQRKELPWSTRKNAVWRESYVKKILNSRTVLGEYQPHVMTKVSGKRVRLPEGEPLKDYYPPVVSLADFVEAGSAVALRRGTGRGRKGATYANLFTGILRCSCGAGYLYINKGSPPKGGKYLQCSVSFSKGACSAKAIRYDLFESIVLEAVEDLDVGVVFGEIRLGDKIRSIRQRRAELIDSVERLRIQANNILDAVKNGGSGSRILGAELKSTEDSIAVATSRIEVLDEELIELTRIDPERRLEVIRKLQAHLTNPNEDRESARRAISAELRRLLVKVVVHPAMRVAWEIADGDTNWRANLGVDSMADLERLCRDLCFDLTLVYRGGDVVHYDAMEGEVSRVKKDVRMKTLEFRAE